MPEYEPVEYRDAPGIPDLKVGTDGSVWTGRAWSGGWTRLAERPDRYGYPMVKFKRAGQRREVAVHRLVLLAFAGPCPPGMEACHSPDRDPRNNRPSNLRYDSHHANILDRDEHGTTPRGERSGLAKLTEVAVRAIRSDAAAGVPLVQLAHVFRVTASNIGHVVHRRTWRHLR